MSVDADITTGLLTGLADAQLRALPDAVLAALTDWADPACITVAAREATRRDLTGRGSVEYRSAVIRHGRAGGRATRRVARARRDGAIAALRAALDAPVLVTRPAEPDAPTWATRLGDTADDDFTAYAESAYLRAEAWTCGHLLSAAGRAADVDPRALFSGPEAWARKHASWELNEWWDAHGRLTVTAFRAGLTGHRAAAEDFAYLEGVS